MSFKKEAFSMYGQFDPELDRKGKNLLSNGDIEFMIRMPLDKVWCEPEAVVFEKIPLIRLSRKFMARRLFWQGVSDYIMVRKRGSDDFYDKNEVVFTGDFVRTIRGIFIRGSIFQAVCMLLRQIGYNYGRMYIKSNRRRASSSPPDLLK